MIYSNKILIQLISFRHILHNLYLQKLSKFIESFKHLYNLLHGLGNAKCWSGMNRKRRIYKPTGTIGATKKIPPRSESRANPTIPILRIQNNDTIPKEMIRETRKMQNKIYIFFFIFSARDN